MGGGKPRQRICGKQNPWLKVDEHLKNSGLQRVTVPGDGNCMFHALACHCSFTHLELRSAVVSFLKEHIQEYSNFFADNEDIQTYMSTLALPGSWGDNLVLQIVAELLQCRIHVAQSHGVQVILPSHNLAEPIWAAYNGASHYDSVIIAGYDCGHHKSSSDVIHESQLCSPSPSVVPSDPEPIPESFFPQFTNCWTLLSANVTSFSSQQGALLEIPFDIAAVQETRHTARSQHGLSLALKKCGYQVVWGKPQPFRAANSSSHTTTGTNGRPGGVGVIARAHIPIQLVPPGSCQIHKKLYHTGRWVHVASTYGNCKKIIHIFSVYGFTGGYSHSSVADQNELFLKDLLEVTYALGPDAPVLIMGDINVEPESSPVLQQAISNGLIFDLGINVGPTFLPAHGQARRLDVVLATKSAASVLRHITSIQHSGLPGHLPVAAHFDLPALGELAPRIRKPAAFPEVIKKDPTLAKEILQQCPRPAQGTADDVYAHFSTVAEMFKASDVSGKRHIGRGQVPKLVQELRFCPQAPNGSGCESTLLRRLKRLLKKFEHLVHLCQFLESAPVMG
jgi:exonuclease III